MITVEVFKTNVHEEWRSEILAQKLLQHFPSSKINFDLEDCDKILRVEGVDICPEKIINLMHGNGHQCEALR